MVAVEQGDRDGDIAHAHKLIALIEPVGICFVFETGLSSVPELCKKTANRLFSFCRDGTTKANTSDVKERRNSRPETYILM